MIEGGCPLKKGFDEWVGLTPCIRALSERTVAKATGIFLVKNARELIAGSRDIPCHERHAVEYERHGT